MGDTPRQWTARDLARVIGKCALVVAWLGFLAVVGIGCGVWLTIKLH